MLCFYSITRGDKIKKYIFPCASVDENDCHKVKVVEEEAEDLLEHVIKKEKEINDGECEVSIKHEPLFWDETELVEHVKVSNGDIIMHENDNSLFVFLTFYKMHECPHEILNICYRCQSTLLHTSLPSLHVPTGILGIYCCTVGYSTAAT